MFLTNLELTHPGATDLIDKGVIGVARSMIPGSLSAVDQTMKFAKRSGTSECILVARGSWTFVLLIIKEVL